METNNVFAFGDTHGGCQMSLVPPEGVPLDNGGIYMPSPFQLKLWSMWREMWDEWLPEATDGEPYTGLHMADAVDGVHHGATTQISHNLNDQHRIALAVLKPVVARCQEYYHLRGTPAHTGDAGMHEEALAAELGAVPNKIGQHARYVLRKMVGPRLVDAAHHIGTTGSQHAESGAIHRELMEALLEAGRFGYQPPDVVIRGHRHRAIKTSIPTNRGEAFGVVTPGWQAHTPFAYKIAGARQSEPQFGGVLIRWSEKRGELFIRWKVWSLEREAPE